MPKPKSTSSPFDALVALRQAPATQHSNAVEQSNVQTSEQPTVKLAKSLDPNYLKFTTYIRKPTHRAVKLALIEQEREMSDLVEELLSRWLQAQSKLKSDTPKHEISAT